MSPAYLPLATVKRWEAEAARRAGPVLTRYDVKGGKLWTASGEPTRRHLELAMWGYSPEPEKLEAYVDRLCEAPEGS